MPFKRLRISFDFQMTSEQFAELPFPAAKELAIMFDFAMSGKFHRDIAATRALNPKISNFHNWVSRNRDAFLSALE